MRKILMTALVLGLLSSPLAQAGDDHAAADPMAAMANCHVCKVYMPHMGELMPVMKNEFVAMNNGMATVTTVTDPEMVGTYHGVCEKMHVAGEETRAFSKAEAEEKLCPWCQKMWGLMEQGAELSYGTTQNGQIMVMSSEDPEVQKKIVAFYKEFQTMTGG